MLIRRAIPTARRSAASPTAFSFSSSFRALLNLPCMLASVLIVGDPAKERRCAILGKREAGFCFINGGVRMLDERRGKEDGTPWWKRTTSLSSSSTIQPRRGLQNRGRGIETVRGPKLNDAVANADPGTRFFIDGFLLG